MYIILIINIIMLITLGIDYRFKVITTTATDDEVKERDVYLNIMTTNKMLYNMVKSITADKHKVEYMFSQEQEQWNFEYTEDSINNLSKKDLFIYSGANYEPWAPDFIENIKKDKVGVINASRGTKILYLSKPKKYKEKDIKENPYYWLSPDEFKVSLSNIKNSIQERDPKNRDYYEQNYVNRVKELDSLTSKFKETLKKIEDYNYIYIGEDFEYLVKYSSLKCTKINNNGDINTEKEKLIKKLEENKNTAIIYGEEYELQAFREIINKHNIKLIKLYKECDGGYVELFNKNLEAFNKFASEK